MIRMESALNERHAGHNLYTIFYFICHFTTFNTENYYLNKNDNIVNVVAASDFGEKPEGRSTLLRHVPPGAQSSALDNGMFL